VIISCVHSKATTPKFRWAAACPGDPVNVGNWARGILRGKKSIFGPLTIVKVRFCPLTSKLDKQAPQLLKPRRFSPSAVLSDGFYYSNHRSPSFYYDFLKIELK
jgi:hypothetical protein